MEKKKSILDVSLEEWPDLMVSFGDQPFRAKQLTEWIFTKRAMHFDEMSNLSQPLRTHLNKKFVVHNLEVDHVQTSEQDGTTRYFFKTHDNEVVSCVYLPFEDRASLCISTQVGCAWGCTFCASGLVKLKRNLTISEIVGQVMLVEKIREKKLDSILFMGMGEPLANYENLTKAVRLLRSSLGLNFGSRHVTISTCGLVPQIEKLGDDIPRVNLAISLHASRDELRKKLLPKSSKWNIKELMAAVKKYSIKTKAKITFEYIVLDGVNDGEQDAKRLANLIRRPARYGDYYVNLIAYNPVPGLKFKQPKMEKIEKFKEILLSRNVAVRLRKPQGVDIGAGCGQLGEAR